MGRTPCCDKAKVKRGPWSPEEDMVLKNYIESHGTGGNWIALPQKAGLKRCGKSCRLRWLNYLRPDIKHGGFTKEEDHIICSLYNNIGSRWSVIASRLPGRTDNDVKNYWNTKLKKRMMAAQVTSSNTSTSIDTTINNQSNHSPSPPPPPPSTTPLIIPTMKNETYTCDYFQKPLTKDPPTPAPINTAFSFSHYNSLPMAGITDSPGYHGNVCEASSLVTVDNSVSYSNWWTTGSGDSDEFFLEFGDGCPVEFLSGSSNAHEKIADITTNLPSSSHFSLDTEAKLQVT